MAIVSKNIPCLVSSTGAKARLLPYADTSIKYDYYNAIGYFYGGPDIVERVEKYKYYLSNGVIISFTNISLNSNRRLKYTLTLSNKNQEILYTREQLTSEDMVGGDWNLMVMPSYEHRRDNEFRPYGQLGIAIFVVATDEMQGTSKYRNYYIINWGTSTSPIKFTFEQTGCPEDGMGIGGAQMDKRISKVLESASFFPDGNPYQEGGYTEEGGGGGNYDPHSDPVDIPGLPLLNASVTGFVTMYNPTIVEVTQLANFMWSDLFDINTLKKLYGNPIDVIMGLSLVPCQPAVGGKTNVHLGGVDTGIAMAPLATNYVQVDCGTLNINEFWGAYLDYDPYTKVEIYLPYIGVHQISADDIMGKPIRLVYNIDVLTGACVAMLKCADSVLYSFMGQCASQIPITNSDHTNVINGTLSIAGSLVGMATGSTSPVSGISNIASASINNMKSSYSRTGSLSGTGGMLSIQKPYLMMTRPRQAISKNQNKFYGFPSFITLTLSSLKGYTEVESIHLENIKATGAELDEIEGLLKGGVIF